MNEISQAIVSLFEEERFYAEIITGMTRILSNTIPMAGVCIKSNIELHINPKAFSALPLAERVAVLKHECEHIFRDHIPRFKKLYPNIMDPKEMSPQSHGTFKRLNVAADMAINPMIKDIPEFAVFPKNFNLPDGETMEWYNEKLKDNKKANEAFDFDGHELWHQSEGSEEIISEKIRKAVTDAADKARAAGKLSAQHELLVSKLNESRIDWKGQLRRFVANAIETRMVSSRKKRNRRYGVTIPGEVKEEILHLGVAMDTSGSVSDAALQQFVSEINKMSKYAKISVVEADTEIKNAYEYNPKKKYKVKGRGGTAYKPVFDHFNNADETIDGLIYFGDMDCFDTEALKKPKYSVLWAIVGNQEPPAEFGMKLKITVEGER